MDKAIKILGMLLVLVSFGLLIAFFATMGQGTESIDSAAGEAIQVPPMTDTIMFWLFGLFGVAIVLSVVVALVKFVKSLISNPLRGLKSIIPVLLFAGIFVVSFIMGSDEKMSIIGYDGTQNEGVWAQITDMFIYTLYSLLVIILVAIFGSRIYTALK